MTKYTCAFQWLKDNEDVVDVVKENDEYKVSCRGIYVGKVESGCAYADSGFLHATTLGPGGHPAVEDFLEMAVLCYTREKYRNKGREVLLKINELENTEDRE